ncbi:hypothetical protein KP509_29G063700 [Ceratopteris richardii]|uniref:SOUL heme-binding protein n=1 Tax=Ceratopteris richardii TaxID=49495 RepID=A0A8T2R9A1_CERRI|nr:hypothetical protein KP509_29G063700 [Ceratopteris richardii]
MKSAVLQYREFTEALNNLSGTLINVFAPAAREKSEMAMARRAMLLLLVLIPMAMVDYALGVVKKEVLRSSVCTSIECPAYDVLYQEEEFSVRLYNGTVWMATSAIEDTSFYEATRVGFLKLFQYIQGANEEGAAVNMTAPVLTGVIPSDGPFCKSSFKVRFFVPTIYQGSPPTPISSLELEVEEWGARYFAVRTFGGFAKDTNVAEEGAALAESVYEAGMELSSSAGDESYYVAQYNSPFEITGRVNEILLPISYPSLLKVRKSS